MMRLLFLLGLGLALTACERPFVDLVTPTVEVVSPDLGVVLTEPTVTLRLRASSFRDVSRIEVNGQPAERRGDAFERTLTLAEGLNPLFVAAFDAGGVVGEDTLWAAYAPFEPVELPWARLPEGRAGHAAVRLPSGRVLVAGGVRTIGGVATDGAFLIDPSAQTVTPQPLRMATPRAGHSMSVAPDGRVYIAGGARRFYPDTATDLVGTVERYDPASGAFTEIPVVEEDGTPAEPVLRTGHTAWMVRGADGRQRLYLYGGLGNTAFGSGPPTLGVLPFVRVLRVEAGRLVAEGPRQRFRFAPMAYGTLTPFGDGVALVAGRSGPADLDQPGAPFRFETVAGSSGLRARAVGPMERPREAHAAAPFAPGLILVTGGRTADTPAPIIQPEVFASTAEPPHAPSRFLSLPIENTSARWGHTATSLADGRILVIGGFVGIGDATSRTDAWLRRP